MYKNSHIHAVRANCLIIISVRSGSGQMWEHFHIWPCCTGKVNSDQPSAAGVITTSTAIQCSPGSLEVPVPRYSYGLLCTAVVSTGTFFFIFNDFGANLQLARSAVAGRADHINLYANLYANLYPSKATKYV